MYQRGLRGDARARRAVGGGARPAHVVPAGAPRRAARAHRRVQRGERRGRRERRQRGQRAGLARSLRRRAAAARGRAPARGSGDARAGGGAAPPAGGAEGALRRGPLERGAEGRAGGGSTEARALGYQPLVAETLLAGRRRCTASRTTRRRRRRRWSRRIWRPTPPATTRSAPRPPPSWSGSSAIRRGATTRPSAGPSTAEAILQRLGGHELLQAWLLNNLGGVYELPGRPRGGAARAAARRWRSRRRRWAATTPTSGSRRGTSGGRSRRCSARNQEALEHVDRSIAILENGLGAGHPELATQLNNRGEILNALGRSREARAVVREGAHHLGARARPRQSQPRLRAHRDRHQLPRGGGSAATRSSPLERAFKIREAQETDPSRRAETRFALARALWESSRDRAAGALAGRAGARGLRQGRAQGQASPRSTAGCTSTARPEASRGRLAAVVALRGGRRSPRRPASPPPPAAGSEGARAAHRDRGRSRP